jgi:hypothetical protein
MFTYPKIYTIGHAAVKDLFADEIVVEEKVDGSQFSFGIYDGEIRCRSKGQALVTDAPEKMFIKAVETVKEIAPLLTNNWTYRGEYLQKPKHNVLAYDRHPNKHIIIFDINTGLECYLLHEARAAEAARIGLESIPVLFSGQLENAKTLVDLLERVSVLGGQKIEGFVVKNYSRFGKDGKVLMGKYVSEAFKEVHNGEWRKENPGKKDIIDQLIAAYKTPARFAKARQHLKEAGKLEGSPRDIGALIKEVQADIEAECSEEIKQKLFDHSMPQILRSAIGGLPQWYKEQLLKDGLNEIS